MREQNATIQDKTTKALERVVNQTISNGDTAAAYLCRLQLPKQFSDNPKQSNDIYKKVQSDFCKSVMRRTGETPRYITVRTENSDNPEYAFCLFTKKDASLDKSEEYAEKGLEIANGKAMHEGWGRGKLDVVELIRDAPRFSVSQSLTLSDGTKATVMQQLQEHLQGKPERSSQPHQRTMFVSKCKYK
ncbi:MAG: hypothetical protein IJJ33_17565 [Victivallales bacterium]|nr:hypothetical protein [Victivallales bacterium]MBQ6473799.1 hypothetical protein [Victivallales bacterium]